MICPDCGEDGGDCPVCRLVGVCAVCDGGGIATWNKRRPCGDCGGSGRAKPGARDAAHYAAEARRGK